MRNIPQLLKLILLYVISAVCIACSSGVSYHSGHKSSATKTGLEVFCKKFAGQFRGKRVALVTNHSGADFNLKSNIALLSERGIIIGAILAPEHGIYGFYNEIDKRPWRYDPALKMPIYNIYSLDNASIKRIITGHDAVIFDIQDMGMRCYTYISNLKTLIDVLDGSEIPLYVLDRPNPIAFLGIDGSNLEDRFRSPYVSAYPAPFLYDMTIGEAARFYAGQTGKKISLKVVKMRGYKRKYMFHETGLPWVPPSPNLPNYQSAIVYTAIVLLEGINVSIGRGTTKPFEYVGAPWIEPNALRDGLEGLGLANFRFKPVYFQPTFSKYAGVRCGGVQIFYTGGRFSPTETAYKIISYILKTYQYAYWERYKIWYDVDTLAGTDQFRLMIDAKKPWSEYQANIAQGVIRYKKARKKYLLY